MLTVTLRQLLVFIVPAILLVVGSLYQASSSANSASQPEAHSNELAVPTIDVDTLSSQSGFQVLRWRDETASRELTELPPRDAWTLKNSKAAARKDGREWFWFRLTNSGTSSKPAIISFDEIFPEEANFYARASDGSITFIKNGLQVPIRERSIESRVAAFELSLDPGETRDIFLSYRTRLEATLGIQVQAPFDFGNWVALQTAGFTFFFGGAIAIIVFNLFLFASLRDSLYLIYSLHASFVVFFVARFSGYTLYIFDTPALHYPLASATWIQAMLLVMFTRRLLETRELSRWVDNGLKAAQIWFAVVAVMTIIDVDFHSVGTRSALFLTLSFLGVGVYSAFKGNPLGVFYTIAQTPYLLGYFLFAGVSIGLLEFSFINRYGFIIGTFFELVTFSLALGYRFKLLEREKFDSQAKLLSLEGSLNDQLVSQVDERTRELATATEALRRINDDYEALLQNMRVGVVRFDSTRQLIFANSAYTDLADEIPGLARHIHEFLDSSVSTGIEELVIAGEGGVEFHLLVNFAGQNDLRDSRSSYWVIVTDVSAMRAQEAILNHASKMATLGEMSTGMAHEINQPLNVIRLTMQNIKTALKKGTYDDSFLQSKIERVDNQITRAAKIISLMRTYGRVAPSTFEPFAVYESIERAVDLVKDLLRLEKVTLETDLADGINPHVHGSSSQFEQVIVNLANNARDAIVGSGIGQGTVIIKAAISADTCVVTVSDTGGGIPDNVIDRIFEPFFTTKGVGEGTGLGGAISYGIIQDMKGVITASNNEEGAVIEITLPLYVDASTS